MFAYLLFRLTLLRIATRELRMIRAWSRDFDKARRQPVSKEEWTAVAGQFATRRIAEHDVIEDDRLTAFTNYLLARGDRLMLPAPPTSDERYWRETPGHGVSFTREGVAYYRQQVEAHEKNQREARIFYLNTLTGLVGALTALAGLIVAWLSRRG